MEVVPSPAAGAFVNVNAIDGVAANDLWVVGRASNDGATYTLTTHWDGAAWNLVSSPNHGTNTNELYSVAALGAADVWAVGYFMENNIRFPLALHWDAAAWTIVPTPADAGGSLLAVSGAASNDVWAVGHALLHWDGVSWTEHPAPPSLASDVVFNRAVARATDDVWVLGHSANYAARTSQYSLLHWDGNVWSIVTEVGGTLYFRISDLVVFSTNDIRVIGTSNPRFDGLADDYGFALQWNGSEWISFTDESFDRSPYPRALAGASADDLWLVGENSHAVLNDVRQWNGTKWSEVSTPLLRSGGEIDFQDVAVVTPQDIWLIGTTSDPESVTAVFLHGALPCARPPGVPKLRQPQADAVVQTQRVKFEWRDAPRAHYFRLQVYSAPDFTNVYSRVTGMLSIVPNVKFPRGADYFWRVRACNNAGCGNWSKVRKFTIPN